MKIKYKKGEKRVKLEGRKNMKRKSMFRVLQCRSYDPTVVNRN